MERSYKIDMKGIIDRFEGSFAVVELENGEMKNIKRELVPMEAKEGDILIIGENITIDHEETEKRRKDIEKLTEDMWE